MRDGTDTSGDLASRLASLVLDELGARLAREVLEGGPLAIARAVRLACLVLDRDAAAALVRAGER